VKPQADRQTALSHTGNKTEKDLAKLKVAFHAIQKKHSRNSSSNLRPSHAAPCAHPDSKLSFTDKFLPERCKEDP
jgi:hypothetical protein